MDQIQKIINYVKESRDFDFSGNNPSMLKRRITKRLVPTSSKNFIDYYNYLLENSQELDYLIDVLTINVSEFFRDSLVFEHLSRILNEIIERKINSKSRNIRIWSCGCASGEEAYSVAILIHDILLKENIDLDASIFATDIDAKAFAKAKKGIYKAESLKNVKYAYLQNYFSRINGNYKISKDVMKMVHFSLFDILHPKSSSPPDSIYGDFDLVLCRNVLIYFNRNQQNLIFKKIINSIINGGYLVLGNSEIPIGEAVNNLRNVKNCNKIYKKYN